MMWLFQSKVRFSESGLLEGMTDCHTHLLPGVDDGVSNPEESLAILSLMEGAGYNTVCLTPHVSEKFPNSTDNLQQKYNELLEIYRGNLTLKLGSENKIDSLFMNRLKDNDFLVCEDSILVETPFYAAPMNLLSIFRDIRKSGYRIIYAHPERYHYLNQNDLIDIRDSGVEYQLNLSSLIGMYGTEAMQNSRWILEKGMYDHIGTDTHSLRSFQFLLSSRISSSYVNLLRSIKLDSH